MAFDAGFTCAVASELSGRLTGGKIEKIFQPTRDSVLFYVHPEHASTLKLIVDVNPSNCRMGITGAEYENPPVPPMMCMLLRKHLSGARIASVTQPVFDRVIRMEFNVRDELGFESKRYAYCELMGRYGNFIFCNADNKVLAAIKTSDISSSELRPVYPGSIYTLPPAQEGKRSPLDIDESGFYAAAGLPPVSSKSVLRAFSGLSPLVCREVECRGGTFGAFAGIIETVKKHRFAPTAVVSREGVPAEYSFFEPVQYGDLEKKRFDSPSELLDFFYSERAAKDSLSRRTADLQHLLNGLRARLTNKINKQREELAACADRDRYRRSGELILANMHLIPERAARATVIDYYSPDCPETEIVLDPRLSPSQNAQKYFRQYSKAVSAEKNLTVQIQAAGEDLDYICSVLASLGNVENESDINEIRLELAEQGYLRRSALNVPKRAVKSAPLKFRTSGGYTVLCGKNNTQNDFLTRHAGGPDDIWFHAKGYHGAHVILQCGQDEPSAEDYTQAAVIAATYSSADGSGKITVDYTRLRNLKKPPSSRPGYVTFSKNFSAYVSPDREMCGKLRVKQ